MDIFFRVRARVPDIIRAPRKGFRLSLRAVLAMPPVEEIAEVLKVSEVTVMRDWSMARSWLRKEVGGGR